MFVSDLDSQLDSVGRGLQAGEVLIAQTEILRFTKEIVAYKWLLLIIGEIKIYLLEISTFFVY